MTFFINGAYNSITKKNFGFVKAMASAVVLVFYISIIIKLVDYRLIDIEMLLIIAV